MASLQQAIDAIDNLVKLLQSGQLLGGKEASAAPSKQAAAPGPAVAPAPADQPKAAPPPAAKAEQQPQAERQPKAEKQPKTEKQPKAAKAVAAPSSSGPSVGEELLSKAQLAVARVVSVADHPSGSEKLLLCRIDWGGGERQVVAGLKQHIAKEDLLGRLVVVVLNLKPAKLAGELSEAMILAASTHKDDDGGEVVGVLTVPGRAEPGDKVWLEGAGEAPAEYPKQCKSDAWKRIVADLKVTGGKATFGGRPLVVAGGGGALEAAGVPEGAEIH